MAAANLREETKRHIGLLLDLAFPASAGSETPRLSRAEAFALIDAVLLVCTAREDTTLAAYATSSILATLGVKYWTFDDYEAQVCREAIQPTRKSEDE